MFITLADNQFIFQSSTVDTVGNTIKMRVLQDEDVLDLEIVVDSNPTVALQIIASALSNYNIVTDVIKELKIRGIEIKKIDLVGKSKPQKATSLVGIKASEYIDEVLAMTQQGVCLVHEVIQTDNGIFIEHTTGRAKVFDADDVTSITFEYLLKELYAKQQDKEIFTF